MENKINIKELAKNLKNLNAPQPIVQMPTVVEKKEEPKPDKTIAKPKAEKVKAIKEKPKSVLKAQAVPKNEELQFALQAETEQYDFSKQVWIDSEIYEILVHIKRRRKIKNISVLVTAIIENYINQNKDAVAQLFAESKWVKG